MWLFRPMIGGLIKLTRVISWQWVGTVLVSVVAQLTGRVRRRFIGRPRPFAALQASAYESLPAVFAADFQCGID